MPSGTPWEWLLVGYGVLLGIFGLVPLRADDRAAAARTRTAPQQGGAVTERSP